MRTIVHAIVAIIVVAVEFVWQTEMEIKHRRTYQKIPSSDLLTSCDKDRFLMFLSSIYFFFFRLQLKKCAI